MMSDEGHHDDLQSAAQPERVQFQKLPDSASADELAVFLRANGVQKTEDFSTLLVSCNLGSVGAIRLFPSLYELVTEMFDCTTKIGKLQAQGFHASLMNALDIREVPLSVCCAPAASVSTSSNASSAEKKIKASGSASGHSSTSTEQTCHLPSAPTTSSGSGQPESVSCLSDMELGLNKRKSTPQLPKMEVDCERVSPHDIKELPSHILAEIECLRGEAESCGLKLTEHVCRPLVQSTAIWLIRLGVTHTSCHPGVFRKVGLLMHDPKCLPMSMLQAGSSGKVIPFENRLEEFMKNRIRNKNSTFQLEVSSEEQLNTPLRSLLKLEKPRVRVCEPGETPAQGHSGRSILGKARSRVFIDTGLQRSTVICPDAAGQPADAEDHHRPSIANETQVLSPVRRMPTPLHQSNVASSTTTSKPVSSSTSTADPQQDNFATATATGPSAKPARNSATDTQTSGSQALAQRIAILQGQLNRMRQQSEPEVSLVRQSGATFRIPSLVNADSSDNDSATTRTAAAGPRQVGTTAPQKQPQRKDHKQQPNKSISVAQPQHQKRKRTSDVDDVRAQLPKGTTLFIPCSAFPKHNPTADGYWIGVVQTNKPTGAAAMIKVKCSGEAAFNWPADEVLKWKEKPNNTASSLHVDKQATASFSVSDAKKGQRVAASQKKQKKKADSSDEEEFDNLSDDDDDGHFSVDDEEDCSSSDSSSLRTSKSSSVADAPGK